jgi:hypothetical protein
MWTLVFDHLDEYSMSRDALFMSRDSGHALVIRDGDSQPVTPPFNAHQPRALWLGADGSYVFESSFVNTINQVAGVGIYVGNEFFHMLRHAPGTVFLDQPGRFATGIDGADSNESGLIVIESGVQQSGTTQSWGVLGLGNGEGFRSIVMTGSSAPELPAGTTFADFEPPGTDNTAWQDHIEWINEDGDVVFFAKLAGAGITAATDGSLWHYDHDGRGGLTMLAREGDLLDVNGQPRTISVLGDGPAFFGADEDSYAFRVTFTDNSLGFFSAPIPEPAGAAAAAAVLFGASVAARRHRRRR